MSQEFILRRDRISQSIYVICCVMAACCLTWVALLLVFTLLYPNELGSSEQVFYGVVFFGLTFVLYGLGWAVRWIISGTATTLLDYHADKT